MNTCYIDEGILLEILPNKIILKLLKREHQCLKCMFHVCKCELQKRTFTSKNGTPNRTEIRSGLPRLVRCVDGGRLPRLSPAAVQYDLDAAGELRGWGRGRERIVSAAVSVYSSDVRITELTSC